MAKKIKEKLAELLSEQTINAATDQSDSTLQSALNTLQQAASSCSVSYAGGDISNVTTARDNWLYDPNSVTTISDSYTINGYGNYNNYKLGSYDLQPSVKLQADNVYIEYNGAEHRLSDIMFKLNMLDNLLGRYPNLITELADMAEKLSKLEQDVALQKLDKIINS